MNNNTWSRYNFLLDSKKIGKFIYNSRTNSFTRINDTLFDILQKKDKEIDKISDSTLKKLQELKVLVEEKEDDEYYYNKKFIKYSKTFSNKKLLLSIATTTNCNLRCPYCYEKGADRSTMDENTCREIIQFIKKNDAAEVDISWYGGEPLLNFNAIRFISNVLKNEYAGKTIRYGIVTNGFFLNEEVIELFRKYRLSHMQVSLDGKKERHDQTRRQANGKGSFDIILKNLENAVNSLSECHFAIRININEQNIKEYPELYHWLKSKFADTANVDIYYGYIQAYGQKVEHCIPRKKEFTYDKMLVEKYKIPGFDPYPGFELGGCAAESINGFVIDPKGRLCKCWHDVGKKDRIIGSIRGNDPIQINYNLLSQYLVADMYEDRKCRNCFLFPVCSGGCAYYRLQKWDDMTCSILPENIPAYLEYTYELISKRNR